jgi:3-isopropylmalate/(R)-2-methylmalate dehydratase small subunit
MKNFNGQVLFLDRSDINTDEIIPARYLTENSRDALRPYLLEDISLEGFNFKTDITGKSVIVTRANFGCGSSREHAPWALEVNGIHLVIAESFARIFRQNMFNCGLMAIELPREVLNVIFTDYAGTPTHVTAQVEDRKLIFQNQKKTDTVPFSIAHFDAELVRTGGWVNYADAHY